MSVRSITLGVGEFVPAVTDAVCPHETGDESCHTFMIVPRSVDHSAPGRLQFMLRSPGEELDALDDPWE